MKNLFDFSFISENIKSVFKNVCEKNKKKAKKERNKKKLKTNKKLIKDVNLSEQKHIIKRIILSFKDYLDDSRLRSQIFKKQKYYICSDFHFYKKYYYLFLSLTYED